MGTVHKKCTHVLDRSCHSETFLRRTGPGEGNEMTRSDLRKSVEGNVEHVGYINSVKLLQTCLAILCKKTGKNSAGLISTMSIDFTGQCAAMTSVL